MLPEIDKRVFEKMDFPNKFLQIRRKYVGDGLDTAIFKKNEIARLFKELNEDCEYVTGGSYRIKRSVMSYLFMCNFIISKNSINIYYDIYYREKYVEPRVTNIGAVLRYLPYDVTLLTNNYGLNSLDDLKNYIREHIKLFEEFVAEYIKEVNAGD